MDIILYYIYIIFIYVSDKSVISAQICPVSHNKNTALHETT